MRRLVYLFAVVVVCGLGTFGCALFVAHHVASSYSRSVEQNRIWTARIHQWALLTNDADDVNDAAIASLGAHDVALHRQSIARATAHLLADADAARKGSMTVVNAAEARRILAAYATLLHNVAELNANAIEFVDQNAGIDTASRLVRVDRSFDIVRLQVTTLCRLLQEMREARLQRDEREVARIQNMNLAATALIVPLLLALVAYCSRLASAVMTARARSRVLRQLQQSEERFQLAALAAGDVIWDWNFVTNTLWRSDQEEAVFGRAGGERPGSTWPDDVHADDQERVLESIHAVVDCGDNFWSENYRMHRADGTIANVHDRAYVLHDEHGKAIRMIGSLKDVSEQYAVERMKDEFISIVSHELRTPLTSIRGALGLIAGGRVGEMPEKARRMIDIAVTNTDRLVRLINDILDIERIDSGMTTLERTAIPAHELISAAVDVVRPLAESSGIRIVASSEAGKVLADSDRIVQTLTNLLSNAIKFTAPRTTIEVGASTDGGRVVFHVRDEGRGIPANKLAIVFERFQQVDASDAREKGGSGLGLAICRSIVRQHAGEIWAESGVEGTTFRFTLPAANTVPFGPVAAPQEAAEKATEPSATKEVAHVA